MVAGAIKGGKCISGNVGASSNTNGSTVMVRCVRSFKEEKWSVRQVALRGGAM